MVGHIANKSPAHSHIQHTQQQQQYLQTQHQQTLEQNTTPHPTYLDDEGNKYDPWPNEWGHKISNDTTNTLQLFTKNLTQSPPPPDKTSNVELHNTIIDLHALDGGILAGQESCIDFKQKDQKQEIKYAYMKKYRNSRTTTACSTIPAAKESYLPGGGFNINPRQIGQESNRFWF